MLAAGPPNDKKEAKPPTPPGGDASSSARTLKALRTDDASELQKRLAEIKKTPDRADISKQLINFLKELFEHALRNAGIVQGTIQMELCVAGSLAKNFATPYSDIDCFLLLGDDTTSEQRAKIKEVTEAVFALSQELHTANRQFLMDPAGINLKDLCGDVKNVCEKIKEREDKDNMGALTVSACNAKSVFGEHKLLSKLQSNLDEFPATYYFNLTIEEYAGPQDALAFVNIKRDILRPLDFMLQGFRKECGLSLQEFNEPTKLLDELVQQKAISDSVRNLIEHIQMKAYQFRLKMHTEAKQEQDDAKNPQQEIRDPVDLVGWLRGCLKHFLKNRAALKIFDLQSHQYLSSKDEKGVADRLARIEILKVDLYPKLRKQQPSTAPRVEAPSLADSKVAQQLKKSLVGVPEELSADELASIAAKLSGNESKSTEKAELVVKALNETQNAIGKDILKRIGIEMADRNEQKPISLKIGSISRIFNVVPPSYSPEEAKLIAANLKERLAPLFGQEQHPDFNKRLQTVLKNWLNESLPKYIFQEILDKQGNIHPQIWKTLYFDKLIGEQSKLDKSILDQITFGLLSSYISMQLGGITEIHQFLNTKENYMTLFSGALQSLMELTKRNDEKSREAKFIFTQQTTFIEEMVISYSLSPIKQSLIQKANSFSGKKRFIKVLSETATQLTKMDIGNLRLAKCFFEQHRSDFDAVIFVECCKIEEKLVKKYKKLQAEHERLIKEKPNNAEKIKNRAAKTFLLFRAMHDVQDFKKGRLSYQQLLVCLETHITYSQAIGHVNSWKSVFKETKTTARLKKSFDQLKALELLEAQLNHQREPMVAARISPRLRK